jgi:transcriptional regulator with XRE-family HTH domain
MAFNREKLREARLRLGLTQRQVQSIAQTTLSAVESGRQRPHPSTLRKLAEEYGVSVGDFFDPPASAPNPTTAIDFDLEKMLEELEESEKPKDLEELRELIDEQVVPELTTLPRSALEAIEADKLQKSSRLDKRLGSPDLMDPARFAEMLKLIEEIRTVRLALYALDRVPAETG